MYSNANMMTSIREMCHLYHGNQRTSHRVLKMYKEHVGHVMSFLRGKPVKSVLVKSASSGLQQAICDYVARFAFLMLKK